MVYSLSRTKVTMHALVWSIFVAAILRAGATVPVPFWQQTVEESMYSSVGIVSFPTLFDSTAADIRFVAATWLNEPKVVEVFSSNSKNGSVEWSYQPASLNQSASTLAVATARHVDANSSGRVDMAVARYLRGEEDGSCALLGFDSKYSAEKPVWEYSIKGNCSVDLTLEGDSKPALKMSDDGSTVAFAVTVYSAEGKSDVPELHCLDGQTGKAIFVFQPENKQPGSSSVSMSRGGDYVAYGNGLTIYVLEKATGQLRTTAPLVRQMQSDVHICPMGTFLLYAINEGSIVRRWNATSKEYEVTPFQPKTPPGTPNTWIAVSHATSVNGEGKNPAGCLAAVGWLGMGGNQGIAKLEVFSMLTGQVYVSWTSNNEGSLENFPVMAMHLGYTALGLWGNRAAAKQPNIYLFHIDSGDEPVVEYSSTGSVMAIDLVYTPYALPPLGGRHELVKNDQEAKVFLIAAGKLEHATVSGRGGRCLAFSIPVPLKPPPPITATNEASRKVHLEN